MHRLPQYTRQIDDRQTQHSVCKCTVSRNETISAGEIYSTIFVQRAVDHSVLVKYIRRYLYNGPLIIRSWWIYSTIFVQRAVDHSVLVSRQWSTFDERMSKNDCHIFVPSDLDLWPLDLKFAPLVTLVQRYVSTKLQVSMAFLLRENLTHGGDDRRTGWNT